MEDAVVPWARRTHTVWGTRTLTADDPRAPDPPGFTGRLWPPQASLLQAMLDLEARPALRVPAPDGQGSEMQPLLRCRSARVAEEFSFGKTITFIALACASRCPKAFPTTLGQFSMAAAATTNLVTVSRRGTSRSSSYTFCGGGRTVKMPAVTARYERLLPTTLVVASPTVISQWEDAIRQFAPQLRAFTIENVRSLRAFYALYRDPAEAPFDLVLLKSGKVTAAFKVPGETAPVGRSEKTPRPLTEALATATEGAVWARMVVDDFDTIRLASGDVFLPSLFTWVISATCRATTVHYRLERAASATEFLRANMALPILGAAVDGLFDNILKLQCSSRYVDEHIHGTMVNFRRITVDGGQALRMLMDLGVAPDVVEMVMAGAIGTAAQAMGLKVDSVGELVNRVLASRTDKYMHALRVLKRVARAREAARASTRPANTPEAVKEIRKTLKSHDAEAAEATIAGLGRMSETLGDSLDSLNEWALGEKEAHGVCIERMRENARQGQCQACMVPIEDASYVVNCCQIVICGYCAVADDGGTRGFIARCPNCAAKTRPPGKFFIYVGAGLDIDGALSDEALADADDAADAADAAPAAPAGRYAQWETDHRLKTLLQLVSGDPVDAALNDEEVDPIVTGLLVGRRDAPRPAGARSRFLIFAMHPESVKNISAAFAGLGIAFVTLSGSRKARDIAVDSFRRGAVDVMLAASSRDCAGLHLPEVTTIVMYHRHLNRHVAAQAVGRGQRVGREYNLEVIEIATEEEMGIVVPQ